MAFKMKGSPFQRNFGIGSALKGLIRGLGPHNPAHKAVGDDSDAAHETSEFQKALTAEQNKQRSRAEESEKKEKANPNYDKIQRLRQELRNVNPLIDREKDRQLREQLKQLQGE